MLTGDYTEMDLVRGGYTIHCLSREGLEAEKIAVNTARCIRHFRGMLRLAGFFQIGRQILIGEEQDAFRVLENEAKKEYIDVPISFPVYYQEGVTVTQTRDPAQGWTPLDEASITLRGRGVRIDDTGRSLPYYPAQVDADGLPSGPNVVTQQSKLD